MSKPRPVIVWYSGGSSGHCCSIRSALVCATRWIVNEKQKRAVITLDGIWVAEADRIGNELLITWHERSLRNEWEEALCGN